MMNKKTERLIFTILAANLLMVAVIGYTIDFSKPPSGIIIPTKAGGVKFNHMAHIEHGSPELTCEKCHHAITDELGKTHKPTEGGCRECHYSGEMKVTFSKKFDKPVMAIGNQSALCELKCEKDEVHKNCIGAQCVSCHKQQECAFCHYR